MNEKRLRMKKKKQPQYPHQTCLPWVSFVLSESPLGEEKRILHSFLSVINTEKAGNKKKCFHTP
jgi:hypothetical protein